METTESKTEKVEFGYEIEPWIIVGFASELSQQCRRADHAVRRRLCDEIRPAVAFRGICRLERGDG